MRKEQVTKNEDIRLAELASYDILDTSTEKEFDQLAELVKQITNCSHVAISFIDKERQWYKSSIGLNVSEIPRDDSFCIYTIQQKEVLVVPDCTQDERFAKNPFVTGAMRAMFYAGTPIVSPRGFNIGSVCVFDPAPHTLGPDQLRSIKIISLQVSRLLELRIKNKLILKKSAELLEMERQTIQYTLDEQDKERKAIGVELHENLAQTVATCMMYLSFATETKKVDRVFIQKTKTELGSMLDEMRRLSKSFNPLSMPYIDLKSIVEESIKQVTRESMLDIKLAWRGKAENVSPNTALNLFRVITQYLRLLDSRNDVKVVSLRITATRSIELEITDDGRPYRSGELQHSVAFNAIATRIQLCQGIYDLKTVEGHGNLLVARLPLYDSRQLA